MYKRLLQDFGFASAVIAIVILTFYLPPASPTSQAGLAASSYEFATHSVEATSTTAQRGIDGFALSKTANGDLLIEVQSEHREADIIIDPAPASGIATLTVEVAGSSEVLQVEADKWNGTISINGRQVASWEHVDGTTWEYSNFDQLPSFTSWHILRDALSDENLREELPVVAALWWVPVLILIVAIVTLSFTITNTYTNTLSAVDNHNSNCATQGNDCADAGYDSTNPACIYWFNNCGNSSVFSDWCDSLNESCLDGNDAACDLGWEHCDNWEEDWHP